jgi:predicted RNA binding protein YcfA (HicA-like mRNA interferase family)
MAYFETGRLVIVPYHAGKNLPVGTLLNILTAAEIPEHEWRG